MPPLLKVSLNHLIKGDRLHIILVQYARQRAHGHAGDVRLAV